MASFFSVIGWRNNTILPSSLKHHLFTAEKTTISKSVPAKFHFPFRPTPDLTVRSAIIPYLIVFCFTASSLNKRDLFPKNIFYQNFRQFNFVRFIFSFLSLLYLGLNK